eukprot:1158677-Pelagomonas_calceolata.AAC.3
MPSATPQQANAVILHTRSQSSAHSTHMPSATPQQAPTLACSHSTSTSRSASPCFRCATPQQKQVHLPGHDPPSAATQPQPAAAAVPSWPAAVALPSAAAATAVLWCLSSLCLVEACQAGPTGREHTHRLCHRASGATSVQLLHSF